MPAQRSNGEALSMMSFLDCTVIVPNLQRQGHMTSENGFIIHRPERLEPMVVAHRGASGSAPENTAASFSLALERGADAVEFDIHQTADGRLVVMHDETLERTTDGTGLIVEKKFGELQTLDAGAWYGPGFAGERIPSLEEALSIITPRAYALVEIKHGGDIYPETEGRIAAVMAAHPEWKGRAVFIAFDPGILQKLREIDSGLNTGLLTADPPEEYLDVAEEFGIQSFFPRWEKLKDESVKLLHGSGYTVHPWVMDREEDVKKVLAMKPDSISSNYPGMLRRLLRQD